MVATARLGMNKQPVGDNVNTWGGILNDQVVELLDEAVAGVETIALTGSVALTSTNFVSNQARNAVLVFTDGGLAAAPTITVPMKEKPWKVINATPFALTFTSGGSPVSLPVGRSGDLICDGSSLRLLEPIAAAASVTQGFASQAAASATAAQSSAVAASTSADLATARANTALSARDSAIAARDTTLGYRDAAATSATNAANSATAAAASAASAAAPQFNYGYILTRYFGA